MDEGKTCTKCKEFYPRSGFYKQSDHKDGMQSHCKQCHGDRPSEVERGYSKKRKQHRDQLRAKALEYYGGICNCCRESEPVFLAIDHLDGSGGSHRKLISNHIFRWLKNNDYPTGFQILCHNCNWAKAQGGCPHGNA